MRNPHVFVAKTSNIIFEILALKTIGGGGATLLNNRPEIMHTVFEYVYKFLDSPRKSLTKMATKAFSKICSFNHDFVL